MRRLRALLLLPSLLLALGGTWAGCAYPRRSMSLTQVDQADAFPPADVYRFEVRSAVIPGRQRSGLPWDEDGGPDAYVRIYRGEELLYESAVVPDSNAPQFDAVAPENLYLPHDAELRFEVWDEDGAFDDPVGIWRGTGLPASALPGADARLMLDGRATLVFQVSEPRTHRGTGILSYEDRGSAFLVLEVVERSPAGRGGVRAGDRIVKVQGQPVGQGSGAMARLNALATQRGTLTVQRDGADVELTLDGGYVWLAE